MTNKYYIARQIGDTPLQLSEPLSGSVAHAAANHLNKIKGSGHTATHEGCKPDAVEILSLTQLCGADFVEEVLK